MRNLEKWFGNGREMVGKWFRNGGENGGEMVEKWLRKVERTSRNG